MAGDYPNSKLPGHADKDLFLNPLIDMGISNDVNWASKIFKVSKFLEDVVGDGIESGMLRYIEREKVSADNLIDSINELMNGPQIIKLKKNIKRDEAAATVLLVNAEISSQKLSKEKILQFIIMLHLKHKRSL